MSDKPITITVSGGRCVGKTWIVQFITEVLTQYGAVVNVDTDTLFEFRHGLDKRAGMSCIIPRLNIVIKETTHENR